MKKLDDSKPWHATDRQLPERQLIRQTRKRERERGGEASPPIWTSAAFRPTSRTDPLGGAACFKKCSIAELFMTRFLFGYGRPSPTLHTGRGERGGGLLVKTFARWIRNTRCRWKISAIIGRPLIIHLSSTNRNEFLRVSSISNLRQYRFHYNPSIKFRTEWTNSIVHIEIRNHVISNIWIYNTCTCVW